MKSEPKAFASLSSGLLARKGAARPAMRPQGFGQGGSGLEDLGWNDMGYDSPKPSLVPVGDGDVAQMSRSPLAGLTPVSPVHDQQAEIEQRFTSHEAEEAEFDEGYEEEEEESVTASFASLAAPYTDDADEGAEEDQDEDALELSAELAEEAEVSPEVSPPAMVVDAHAPLVPFASAFERAQREAKPALEQAQPEAEPVLAMEPGPQVDPEPVVLALEPQSVIPPAPTQAPSARTEPLAKGKAAFTLRLDPARHLKLRLACAVTGQSAQQLVTRALDELLASMPELEAMAERAPAERIIRKG